MIFFIYEHLFIDQKVKALPSLYIVAFWWANAWNIKSGQTTIWEEIEIYSQEKVYTIERLLVEKNIGLVNTE